MSDTPDAPDAPDALQKMMNEVVTQASALEKKTRETRDKVGIREKNERLKRTLAVWTLLAFTTFVGVILFLYAVRFLQLTLVMPERKSLLQPDKWTELRDIGGQMVDVIKTFYVPVVTLVLGYFFGREHDGAAKPPG